ncbi:MAG: baseplate assembly protein [Gammaproteobacteria bacterium]|nr:MAG: baseplate assembly protein [Gammaproteobacteria bacterium]
MAEIDLSQLPRPDIVESLDFETIFARRKATFISLYPESEREDWENTLALESEPVTKLLQESAYMELLLRQRINHSARATMLAYATGTDLDNLAANFGTVRLLIRPADDSTVPPTPALYESDEDLRHRTQLAFEGITTAGPIGSYRYHAMSANAKVKDVSITSPVPGEVLISVLSIEGEGQADAELLDSVYQACNAEDVRPLCDTVVAQSANIVQYQIEASLILYPEVTESLSLKVAQSAIEAFVEKHHRIGHDITLSGIHRALHQEGVQNVHIGSPAADIIIDELSAGKCTEIKLSFGGRDEESNGHKVAIAN